MQLIKIIKVYNRLRQQSVLQKYYNHQFLEPFLYSLENKYNGRFTNSFLKKIKKFYCLLVPTVLCSSYCNLAGRTFTEQERKKATIISLMTPLYDDFFDNKTLSADQIEIITKNPADFMPQTFEEKVFRELHIWMIANVPDAGMYKSTFENIYKTQLSSVKQTNPQISEAELYNITYDKCYYAFLIYHEILDFSPNEEFKKMTYTFAGLLQIGNDAFDVYKDLQDGIYTLPNLHRNFTELKKKFNEGSRKFNLQVMKMNYQKEQKEDFLITINFIIARAWVALMQIEKLLKLYGKDADFKKIDRKHLICDMQKPSNIVKWLKYTYVFSK